MPAACVHRETRSTPSEPVTLGSKVLGVAGLAENLIVVVVASGAIQQLVTVGCQKKPILIIIKFKM